tara:strand:+ start:3068 stop:3499 length:432 start_codon:yes stop_codon:yes gene_type:complete
VSITIHPDPETRRKAAALAAAMIEGDPRARLADFVDLLVGSSGRTVARPSLDTGDYRGRPGDLLAAVSSSCLSFTPRVGTVASLRAAVSASKGSPSRWYAAAVAGLWAEVCGPDADRLELQSRPMAAHAPVGLLAASQYAAAG